MKKKKIKKLMEAAGWQYMGKLEKGFYAFERDEYRQAVSTEDTLADIMRVITDNVHRECTIADLKITTTLTTTPPTFTKLHNK